jgi:two-component system, NtrC family, sensor kinase
VSLKKSISLIMGLTILFLLGLSAAILIPVSSSFSRLEETQAQQDNERVLAGIDNKLETMARSALDWATWDDTYAFIAGEGTDYVESNLNFNTQSTLDLNLMAFYDQAGNIAWSKIFDLETEEEISLPQFAPGGLLPTDLLLTNTVRRTTVRGILATERGPMLVVSAPVVPTEDTAPANGTIVIGRFLDASQVEAIHQQTHVGFEVIGPDAEGNLPSLAGDSRAFSIETTGDVLVAHAVLPDLYGAPLFEVRSTTERDVTALGDSTIQRSLLLLVGIGMTAVALIWILLQRLVLRRVERLTEHVVQVANSGVLDRRVPAVRGDELGILAREFNRMLDRLADARRQLIEQSHQAGMSEMAAGVLHNLRNGLSPLVGRLDALCQKMRGAPGGEIGRAVEELGNAATPDNRRQRLLEYLRVAGTSFAQLKEQAIDDLAQTTVLARKLGEILSFQEKFIYSRSTVEPTSVQDALAAAIGLLPEPLRDETPIAIDPSIERLPPILAEQVTLIQVLYNLLLNAAEAIARTERGHGHITVSAAEAQPGTLSIRICDDGVGIDEPDLARVFERGYTTKPAGSGGLGLHWCANAVTHMQGQLTAESAGCGSGATFALALPAAEQRLAA